MQVARQPDEQIPMRRLIVAEAVTAAVEEFCASRGQAVAGRPRRWSQCSAGKSKKASSASRSLVRQAIRPTIAGIPVMDSTTNEAI